VITSFRKCINGTRSGYTNSGYLEVSEQCSKAVKTYNKILGMIKRLFIHLGFRPYSHLKNVDDITFNYVKLPWPFHQVGLYTIHELSLNQKEISP